MCVLFYVRVVVEITEKIVSISKGVTYVFNHAFISSRGWTNLFDVVHLKRLGFLVDWRLRTWCGPSSVDRALRTCTILAWRSEVQVTDIFLLVMVFVGRKVALQGFHSAPLTHEYSKLGLLPPASGGSKLLCFLCGCSSTEAILMLMFLTRCQDLMQFCCYWLSTGRLASCQKLLSLQFTNICFEVLPKIKTAAWPNDYFTYIDIK